MSKRLRVTNAWHTQERDALLQAQWEERRQRQEFILSMAVVQEDVLLPEDIFTEFQLRDWAKRNGFIKQSQCDCTGDGW